LDAFGAEFFAREKKELISKLSVEVGANKQGTVLFFGTGITASTLKAVAAVRSLHVRRRGHKIFALL
jgi:hypothetical protein